ncbi:MAG: aminomethyl-transferring glycine dehydrogenase subunit GcvPB [Fimbriimonadaceae bacterium]
MIRKSVPEPKSLFEKSSPGRTGCNLPKPTTPQVDIGQAVGKSRDDLRLPEIAELDLIRHFTNLSHINYGIDTGFYPLGSCTMKYNPRINERTAGLTGFTQLHPLQPEHTAQGALEVLAQVYDFLKAITAFDEITMQPVAGAHGEQTCLQLIKAYHESRGEAATRTVVLVPDSAHGTNPASAARCGYTVRSIHTNDEGNTDLAALEQALDSSVAAFMVTNPSTLGLFEPHITKICEMVHKVGGQVFCDGANMNAMVGTTRPGDHGFDCMHLNLHKTFSTPHGGGGPGCGAIGLQKHLAPFLPVPHLVRVDGKPKFDYDRPLSIGRVSGYNGQFLMAVRALTYMAAYGREGLPEISRHAVLNANYVKARLKDVLPAAHDRPCMHECVLTGKQYKKYGVRVLDISKRLIDYGFHPPTNYFPLIVPECLMIEPTETECKETLDAFCDALIAICKEAETNPELLHSAPTSQVVGRLNEAKAVKDLDVKWSPARQESTV